MLHVFSPPVSSETPLNYLRTWCEQTLTQKLQFVSNPNDCRITEPVNVRLFWDSGVITGGSACTYTHTHAHAGCVWECIRVSEGYCFIRACFIQLLSDSTREKNTYRHTPTHHLQVLGRLLFIFKNVEAEKTLPFAPFSTINKLFLFETVCQEADGDSWSRCLRLPMNCLAGLCWATSNLKLTPPHFSHHVSDRSLNYFCKG